MPAVSPQAIAAQRQGRSRIFSTPAPIGGWNTRDGDDVLPPTDAIELTNLFPTRGSVEMRGGYEDYVASGIGSDLVETIFAYKVGAQEVALCGTNGNIYDITSPAAASSLGSGYTDDRWECVDFRDSTTLRTYAIGVNGTDAPWIYDRTGTTFGAWGATGPTMANLAWIQVYKNRIFCGETGSRDFWFTGLGARAGAMTRFPLQGVRGAAGAILFMAHWTRDGGAGPDDFAAFVTDLGFVIVYTGLDPTLTSGTAADWSLVGVYQIPRPLSRRSYANVLGDVVIATESDYVFLSEAIQQQGSVINATKLSGAIEEAAGLYFGNTGFELTNWPRGNRVISNIPKTVGSEYEQHVMNLQTRAGCKYEGWDFSTFGVINGNLYAGGVGKVYHVETGLADDINGTPAGITITAKTAWNDFQSPGTFKHVTGLRPVFRVSEPSVFDIAVALETDFDEYAINPVSATGTAPSNPDWRVDTTNTATFTADAVTDTLTSAAHGLSNGETVRLTSTGTLPAGIDTAGETYYVINTAANTFQLALTAGGAAIDITSAGTGTHTWIETTLNPWDTTAWATEVGSARSREWRLNAAEGSDFSVGLSATLLYFQFEWISTDYMIEPTAGF